jgi:hypothetical protein
LYRTKLYRTVQNTDYCVTPNGLLTPPPVPTTPHRASTTVKAPSCTTKSISRLRKGPPFFSPFRPSFIPSFSPVLVPFVPFFVPPAPLVLLPFLSSRPLPIPCFCVLPPFLHLFHVPSSVSPPPKLRPNSLHSSRSFVSLGFNLNPRMYPNPNTNTTLSFFFS